MKAPAIHCLPTPELRNRRREEADSTLCPDVRLLTSAAAGLKLFSPASGRSRNSAFTMVEIALCLAIIGFALVAIIGVLPVGLNVQKENREETIVNQDAVYFMDAIRNGARGLDDLTNYVFALTNSVQYFEITSGATNPNGPPIIYGYSYFESRRNGALTVPQFRLDYGSNIVGLLSTPTITGASPSGFFSNRVVAYVRALSGAATEKFPQNNVSVQDLAFTYRIITEIVPVQTAPSPIPDPNSPNFASEAANYTNRQSLQANLHEVRLRFIWPLFPNGSSGNGRQTYRSLAGGSMTNEPRNTPLWFFQSAKYVNVP